MSFTSGGGSMRDANVATRPLAAIVFAEGDDINEIMAAFVADLARTGLHVAGFVQEIDAGPDGHPEAHVRDVETGACLPIFQNLGRAARSCRIDPTAVGEVGRLIAGAVDRRPDLIVVNRFGRLESEGEGIIDEIAMAVTAGIPVLIGVAARYAEAWRQFAAGFDQELACSREALDAWWREQMGQKQVTAL
jgi:Protein of unknown function (DUF2478)